MTKIQLAKNAASIVVAAGTSRIVGSIISNNVTPSEKITDKVTVPAASVVIGMMAADKVRDYTDNLIDEAVAWYQTNVKK